MSDLILTARSEGQNERHGQGQQRMGRLGDRTVHIGEPQWLTQPDF